jgi:hypothetical protein
MKMSAELEAMLARPRNEVAHSNQFGQQSHTKRQQRLNAAANKRLRKAGFYQPKAEAGVIPAEACGVNGLRPTWHGRAS